VQIPWRPGGAPRGVVSDGYRRRSMALTFPLDAPSPRGLDPAVSHPLAADGSRCDDLPSRLKRRVSQTRGFMKPME